MAVIGQRTFTDGVDQYVALTNESLVRPLAMGTNWTTIRIAFLCAIDSQEAASFTGAQMSFGVSCGTTNPYSANTTTHSLLITSQYNGYLGTFTYNAGSGNPYFTGNGWGAIRKVGTTQTFTAGNNATQYYPAAGTGTPRRMIVTATIQRNYLANQYLIYYTVVTPVATLSFTQAHLIQALDQTSTSATIVINGASFTAGALVPTVFESAGLFDTLEIYWNKQIPFEIYGYGVTRCS
jgi:hypothetical protein